MIICKNCGVELDEDMLHCPLCGLSVKDDNSIPPPAKTQPPHPYAQAMSQPQKKFTWEIVSLVLLSATVATFIIDFIINKRITWSEYPAAISLIIFWYVSLFAFWRQSTIIQMAGGFILSAAFMIALDAITGGTPWAVRLGIPLLLVSNLVVIVLLVIIRTAKHKGVNLLAWAFLGAGLLCIGIEGILSYFKTRSLYLEWSVIAGSCIIPVVLVLLFVHFRLKKGRSLKKTFHI